MKKHVTGKPKIHTTKLSPTDEAQIDERQHDKHDRRDKESQAQHKTNQTEGARGQQDPTRKPRQTRQRLDERQASKEGKQI